MSAPYPPGYPPALTCYRHPDRQTYVQCTRCGRPVCPECMRSAAVGHQCVDCVAAAAAAVPPVKTVRSGSSGRIAFADSPVTYSLIAVNVVMFVLHMASRGLERQLVLWPPAVATGEWWRIFTSAFMHYGITHILFNMWALWVVGPPLERWLGRNRFLALYVLSALGGGVLAYLLSPLNSATAGASGAIFGLFGATLVIGRRVNMDTRGIMAVIVLNLAFTFVIPLISGMKISWQGHIGGLLTGMLVAWIYAYTPHQRRNSVHVWASVAILVVFAALVWWRTGQILAFIS